MLQERSSPMAVALSEAEAAASRDEVPVGAVIVDKTGNIIARSGNRTRELRDPTGHAEIIALRTACRQLASERINDCDLYVTLEPCPMCATAISFARIRRLYYGASDPKSGGVEQGARIFTQPTCHHVPEIYPGIDEERSSELLRAFFAARRN